MKAVLPLLILVCSLRSMMAAPSDPILVEAVVQELKLSADSPPDNNRGTSSPAIWEVNLIIQKVLRGQQTMVGFKMHTLTAYSIPQGNARVVVPRLNVGDIGIWALNSTGTGELWEVYDPYEIEKGVRLPLIKGRHDAYEKVLSRLSGGQAPEPSSDVIAQEPPSKPVPSANPPPLVQPPSLKKTFEQKPTPTTSSEEPASSTPWTIIVAVSAALGLLWLLLKRRS